jgi:hypothetical protein
VFCFASLLRYNAYKIILQHERLHISQAMRVLEAEGFPKENIFFTTQTGGDCASKAR